MFDWNDLRYFLEVARRGKLSAAAVRIGVDHTTVARRISALEDKLKVQLFHRENRAYILSDEGKRLLSYAEQMEDNSLALMAELTPAQTGPTGVVRLTTPEAFGSIFVAPRCNSFRSRNPGVILELVAETRPHSFTKREADVAITLAQPQHGRISSQQAGNYRLAFYAAPSYLQAHPPIVQLSDLKNHQFIWYVDELLPVPELQILDKAIPEPNVIFRTTSVAGQAHAAQSGLGIALLPCFVADTMKGLTPILPRELSIIRELWLSTHSDAPLQPHVESVCVFMTNLVASERDTLLGTRK